MRFHRLILRHATHFGHICENNSLKYRFFLAQILQYILNWRAEMKKFIVLTLLSLTTAAYATVWYVHPDSALNSIQAALDSCSNDDTVLVGPGSYWEFLEWPKTQGVDLISEYGSDTTTVEFNGYMMPTIWITTGVSWTTIINGFTITSHDNCAIGCENSSPTITGNVITENSSNGIYCVNSNPVISNNVISNNGWGDIPEFGGGICLIESSPIISYNTINDNEANHRGGGIACLESSPIIVHNSIFNNSAIHGGGVYVSMNSCPLIDSCTISNNDQEGIYCCDGNAIINFCDIVSNNGYGVFNEDSSFIINAIYNWWGDASGPGGAGPGTGDEVSAYVDYTPWLDTPFGIEEYKPITKKFTALQIYPNPFREKTEIAYGVQCSASNIEIKIYDIAGRVVKDFSGQLSVISDQSSVIWDGCDDAGNRVPSSIYFIKFSAGNYKETKKLVLLK
jgi:parallel beta-helix repeat protein